jgi:hypothetical protein
MSTTSTGAPSYEAIVEREGAHAVVTTARRGLASDRRPWTGPGLASGSRLADALCAHPSTAGTPRGSSWGTS